MSWILDSKDLRFFKELSKDRKESPDVLWGWKRDLVINGKQYPESRTIYFSADLDTNKNSIHIKRAFFYLNTRAKIKEIEYLKRFLVTENYTSLRGREATEAIYKGEKENFQADSKDYSKLIFKLGNPSDYDLETISRLLKRKPRLIIDPPKLITPSRDYDLSKYSPFAIYAGSGLSSESGLPYLSEIHKIFEVDDFDTGEFIFGAKDKILEKVINNTNREFKKFCQFNVDAIKSKLSDSHLIIQKLYKKGLIKQVFTDNVDHLFKKINIPFIQTRLSIFPDRFNVRFDQSVKSLLVIGVAVDRRQVIKQARKRGLKIIVINPVLDVAPCSRNIDYLKKGDIFFKGKAGEVLPKIEKFLSNSKSIVIPA